MAHIVEIDQSGRVEKSGATIIAFANNTQYAIRIPSRTARAGLAALQAKRTSANLRKPLLWAACVYLLLEGSVEYFLSENTKVWKQAYPELSLNYCFGLIDVFGS